MHVVGLELGDPLDELHRLFQDIDALRVTSSGRFLVLVHKSLEYLNRQ